MKAPIPGTPRKLPTHITSDSFVTGDVLVCYGRGVVSWVIKWFTPRWRFWRAAPSHVAIIARHIDLAPNASGDRVVFVHESTTLGKIEDAVRKKIARGVQMHRYANWLENYDGKVYLYPLKVTLPVPGNTVDYLIESHYRRTPYDTLGAFRSASPVYNSEDGKALFCSEYVAFALRKGGALPIDLNPSEVHPHDVTRWKCFGTPRRLA